MGRPLIKIKLEREGYNIIDFGEYYYDGDRGEIHERPGVYCLLYGDTLQYVGHAINLKNRLRQHLDNKRNGNDGYIPFGNYSWYVLNKRLIVDAEDFLIRTYDPRYNYINAKRGDI